MCIIKDNFLAQPCQLKKSVNDVEFLLPHLEQCYANVPIWFWKSNIYIKMRWLKWYSVFRGLFLNKEIKKVINYLWFRSESLIITKTLGKMNALTIILNISWDFTKTIHKISQNLVSEYAGPIEKKWDKRLVKILCPKSPCQMFQRIIEDIEQKFDE